MRLRAPCLAATSPVAYREHVSATAGRCRSAGSTLMAESWSGEFYCVKCKAKREATGEVRVNDKGTRMAKATCPVCSTNLNRILGRA